MLFFYNCSIPIQIDFVLEKITTIRIFLNQQLFKLVKTFTTKFTWADKNNQKVS